MTDLESELRAESTAVNGGKDVLVGYRLVDFDPNGGSMWFHRSRKHHLYRETDGSVVDPTTLSAVNYTKDASYQEKERVPHE